MSRGLLEQFALANAHEICACCVAFRTRQGSKANLRLRRLGLNCQKERDVNAEFADRFLLWCTTINYVVLILWFGAFVVARRWILKLHGCWFRLTEERFSEIHYGGMAIYKI